MHFPRAAFLLVSAVATFAFLNAKARAPAAELESGDHIQIEHSATAFTTTISIRATDGRVESTDVMRGIARAKGFDDMALDGVFPDKPLRISSVRGVLITKVLSAALQPHIELDIHRDESDGFQNPNLVITLDRAALLASQRRLKNLLRDRGLAAISNKLPIGEPANYGIKLDDNWQDAPRDKNVVILLHGLNSEPHNVESLLAGPREVGFPCGTFTYPNDQPLTESAQLLAAELRALLKKDAERSVTLLTHSMGGLVARAAIEDPELDPGNVRQLLMIAPPNHGSVLANFAFGLDVWEHVVERDHRPRIRALYESLEDGLADAAVDLRPDSVFLLKLNARDRNPRVRYTIILGDKAALAEDDLAAMRRSLEGLGDRNRWARFFGAKADAWLADMDEVVDDRGDGAVALKRGKLAGVDDVTVLRFGHTEVLDLHPTGDAQRVREEILGRLLSQ